MITEQAIEAARAAVESDLHQSRADNWIHQLPNGKEFTSRTTSDPGGLLLVGPVEGFDSEEGTEVEFHLAVLTTAEFGLIKAHRENLASIAKP